MTKELKSQEQPEKAKKVRQPKQPSNNPNELAVFRNVTIIVANQQPVFKALLERLDRSDMFTMPLTGFINLATSFGINDLHDFNNRAVIINEEKPGSIKIISIR